MPRIHYKLMLALLVLGLSLAGSYAWAANQLTAPLRLSASLDGPAITTSDYLFWPDKAGPLYGYNLTTRATFTVSNTPGRKRLLASDDKTVAWVQDGAAGVSIQGYNLGSGAGFQLIAAKAGREFGGLALAANTLYYKDATPGHSGLYALDLASKQERLISAAGQNPVAGSNAVIWSEEKYQGEHLPSEWRLRMLRPGNSNIIDLAKAEGPFEVSAAGDYVVWAAIPPASDRKVYFYQISRGQSQAISSTDGRQPATNGAKIAWVGSPTGDNADLWSVKLFDPGGSGSLANLVAPGTAKVELNGFAGAAEVAFTVYRGSASGSGELYLAGIDQRDLSFSTTSRPTLSAPAVAPLNCGQVYKQGYFLNDCGGRWTVNGVQFILPDYGINGNTFRDGNYSASVGNGQVDYWLNKASNELGAKNLRIFVDMPNDTLPGPTSPATIYDFAQRANSRGMRLGVVLHNDTSWTLTPARKQWLSDFIGYFRARNALSLLAYFNADNEINNHCGDGPDCYDNNPTYVDKANRWVADFTGYVKSLNPAILITVGITTEKPNTDGQNPVYNFFRTGGSAPSLAASVDFLSPHNYGGGGYGIWPALRYNLGYQGPIVLEEYGFSTDPHNLSPYYREGDAVCRDDPYNAVCYQTAPYFVEVNLRSMRENTTNGFAGGSAWMIADSNNKDCGSPGDFYTGLFASGRYTGCGGTITTTGGAPKSTAARIRFHYLGSTVSAPAAPTNLVAVAVAPRQVNLSWTDNSNNELNFRIERKTGAGGSWSEIGTSGANTATYQDSGLQDAAIYYYRVRAYASNGSASYSGYSGEAPALTPFPAPSALSAQANPNNTVSLKWTDNSNSESGFKLERRTGTNGNWAQLALTAANATAYTDNTTQPGATYYYRMVAYTATSTSAYSNEASASVVLPAPAGLNATLASAIQINLSWTDSSTGESGFKVERRSGTGNWAEIGSTGPNVIAFRDLGLDLGVTYYYRVRAFTGAGVSDYSNEASAATPTTANYTVTNPDANASGTDTLSYALAQASAGQTILLNPTGNTINISAALPELKAGVVLIGRCGTGGPEITLQGTNALGGLALHGNTTLYGLKILGFSNPQLKTEGSGNQLKCIKTG